MTQKNDFKNANFYGNTQIGNSPAKEIRKLAHVSQAIVMGLLQIGSGVYVAISFSFIEFGVF